MCEEVLKLRVESTKPYHFADLPAKEQKLFWQPQLQQTGIYGKQIEEEKDKLKVMLTCLEISRRIVAGDTVPAADHQYLLDHDPALYARSISMRLPKDNPYEYEQISEDDDKQLGVIGCVNCLDVLAKGVSLSWWTTSVVLDIKV